MSLNEVKVFDANGKLKKIISPEQLTEIHWEEYRQKKGKTSQERMKAGRAKQAKINNLMYKNGDKR